jgi:hypothetical protein
MGTRRLCRIVTGYLTGSHWWADEGLGAEDEILDEVKIVGVKNDER